MICNSTSEGNGNIVLFQNFWYKVFTRFIHYNILWHKKSIAFENWRQRMCIYPFLESSEQATSKEKKKSISKFHINIKEMKRGSDDLYQILVRIRKPKVRHGELEVCVLKKALTIFLEFTVEFFLSWLFEGICFSQAKLKESEKNLSLISTGIRKKTLTELCNYP